MNITFPKLSTVSDAHFITKCVKQKEIIQCKMVSRLTIHGNYIGLILLPQLFTLPSRLFLIYPSSPFPPTSSVLILLVLLLSLYTLIIYLLLLSLLLLLLPSSSSPPPHPTSTASHPTLSSSFFFTQLLYFLFLVSNPFSP